MRFALLLSLLIAAPALGQSPGTVHGVLVETSTGPYAVGSTYAVTLRLRAEPGPADLGTSTFVLDFDGTATSFAGAPTEGPAADYTFANYQGAQTTSSGALALYNSTVVLTNPNRLTVAVQLGATLDTQGRGQALPETLTDVVTLRFTVAEAARPPMFSFNNVQANTGPGLRYTNGTFTGIGGPTAMLTGTDGWRMLALPASMQTLAGLVDPFWTQGYSGADSPNGTANVLRYAEGAACDAEPGTPTPCDASTGYVAPGSQADALPSGAGVFVYVYADDDMTQPGVQGGFPKTLSASGPEPAAPFTFSTVTFTPAGGPDADGWNLVGNPFQVTIDWDEPTWTRTNVDQAAYVWDPAQANYRVRNGGVGNLTDGLIAPFQGFWAKANGPSPVLTVPAAARATGGTVYGLDKPTDSPETLGADETSVVALRLDGAVGGAARTSEAFLAFRQGGLLERDPFDAYALTPPAADYALLWAALPDGIALSISALPSLESVLEAGVAVDVPVGLDIVAAGAPAGGTFRLTWPAVPELAVGRLILVDTESAVEVDLASATEYPFTVEGPASAARAPAGDVSARQAALSRSATERDREDGPSRLAQTPGAGASPAAVPGLVRTAPVALARGGSAARFVLRYDPAGATTSEGGSLPEEFELSNPYPNPSRQSARLQFALPSASEVEVWVYDLLGRRVLNVASGARGAGRHTVELDTGALASGVYAVRAEMRPVAGGASSALTRRLSVVR